MKRSQTIVGLAALLCLGAASVKLVFGDSEDSGTPAHLQVPQSSEPAQRQVPAAILPGNPTAAEQREARPLPPPPPPEPSFPPEDPPVRRASVPLGGPEPSRVQPAVLNGPGNGPSVSPPVNMPALVGGTRPSSPVASPAAIKVDDLPANVEGSTGRQEPSVSIEWNGPAAVRLNQAASYQIIAKNVSSGSVHNVLVRYRIPAGVEILGSEPRAFTEGGVMVWDLGTLLSSQEKQIAMQIVPLAKTALNCQAFVTFTGASTLRVQVREPRLVIKTAVPERVVMGDNATTALTVCNPGDGPAEHIKIKIAIPEGLEHARGNTIDLELGSLAAGEDRTVQLVCLAKTAGPQVLECSAVADSGLTAKHNARLEVVLPRLDLAVTGPKLRYLDRHATYVLKVTNPGSALASNVSIVHQLPEGFRFQSASSGGRHDFNAKTVAWFVGELAAGESREVTLEAVPTSVGEHQHRTVATGARGLKADCETVTQVEGLSALQMELIDVEDPIEVGADTVYEIRVTNTGSKMETNLELVCTIPEKMQFRDGKCGAGCNYRLTGREITFDPLPRLAPRADVVYRVVVRGVAAGDMRFRARIRADGLSEPVLREESTKVYGD